jgi:hypothetical protein
MPAIKALKASAEKFHGKVRSLWKNVFAWP